MALTHILTDGTENGETASIKINAGFTQTDANVSAISLNTTNIAIIDGNVINNDAEILELQNAVTANDADILELQNTDTYDFTNNINTPPTYLKGRMYYDNTLAAFGLQGEFSDVDTSINRQLHLKVINNSGVAILKGDILRYDGAASGWPEVAKALADTFDNARILGVAAHDIAIGAYGNITTQGVLNHLDTSGITPGVPIYLSDTVPGAYTETPPFIKSRVGGVVVSATDGRMVVDIINNLNLPQFGSFFQNSVNTLDFNNNLNVYQEFDNFLVQEGYIIDISSGNSFLVPYEGFYKGSFTISMSNITANVNGHIIDIEIFNKSTGTGMFVYKMLVGRSDTVASCSFSSPIILPALSDISMRYRSSSSVGAAVVIDGISMSIESKHIA